MGQDVALHLRWLDALTAADDHILLATNDGDYAVLIHEPQVTRVVPSILIEKRCCKLR
jgi:hypothetical protein